MYYTYTGEIDFAPFGSEANRDYRASEKPKWEMDNPPRVSPKSIYRLADKVTVPSTPTRSAETVRKYDIPELRRLAWERILDNLGCCDLVEEIFSDFTFLYVHADLPRQCLPISGAWHRFSFPNIQGIQVQRLVYLILTSDDSTSEDIIKRLRAKLSTLSGVRLERSADTLGMLWEELSKAKAVPVEKGPSIVSLVVSIRCPRFV